MLCTKRKLLRNSASTKQLSVLTLRRRTCAWSRSKLTEIQSLSLFCRSERQDCAEDRSKTERPPIAQRLDCMAQQMKVWILPRTSSSQLTRTQHMKRTLNGLGRAVETGMNWLLLPWPRSKGSPSNLKYSTRAISGRIQQVMERANGHPGTQNSEERRGRPLRSG